MDCVDLCECAYIFIFIVLQFVSTTYDRITANRLCMCNCLLFALHVCVCVFVSGCCCLRSHSSKDFCEIFAPRAVQNYFNSKADGFAGPKQKAIRKPFVTSCHGVSCIVT